MIERLTKLMETQLNNAEAERRDAIKREEKMQQLLDTALNKPPDKDRDDKMQQLIEAALNRQPAVRHHKQVKYPVMQRQRQYYTISTSICR